MKRILFSLLLLCVLSVGLMVMAQPPYDSYVYQSNPLCELKIDLAADAPIIYRLTFDGTTANEGALNVGETAQLRLPTGNTWYIVTVEFAEEDRDRYTINTALACPLDVPTPSYAELEAMIFARAGWGQEDIVWFRQWYTVDESGRYGSQRTYIEAAATGYALIDQYTAMNESTPTPYPTAVMTPTAEPVPLPTETPQ